MILAYIENSSTMMIHCFMKTLVNYVEDSWVFVSEDSCMLKTRRFWTMLKNRHLLPMKLRLMAYIEISLFLLMKTHCLFWEPFDYAENLLLFDHIKDLSAILQMFLFAYVEDSSPKHVTPIKLRYVTIYIISISFILTRYIIWIDLTPQ